MTPLVPPDSHHLLATQGWLELGNPAEAAIELARIDPEFQSHPDVLALRWHLLASNRDWAACVDLAEHLLQLAPTSVEPWIHRSYALHELGRTLEAHNQLLPAVDAFPEVWTLPYNLACYCARLNRLTEARSWLQKALSLDEPTTRQAAATDSDLQPLRESNGGLFGKPPAT